MQTIRKTQYRYQVEYIHYSHLKSRVGHSVLPSVIHQPSSVQRSCDRDSRPGQSKETFKENNRPDGNGARGRAD
jgi:hypothetical protein